jgi:hypothetical protein
MRRAYRTNGEEIIGCRILAGKPEVGKLGGS